MSIGVLHGQNGGGKGAALTVTAPAGSTVTVSKDGKTLTLVAGADGVVVFRGLETGTWNLSITDGTQTASKPVDIVADYATSITFFEATIHITYPAGSVCTATDGVTTLTAPDTSGTWDCVVPNAGAWTVTVTDKGWTDTAEITQDGQVANIYLDKLYLYKGGVVRNAYFVHNGAVTNENGKLIARMGNNANQALLFHFTESVSGINSIQIKARVISTGSAYHTAFVSKYDIYSSATNNRLSAVDMPATSDEQVYSIDLSGINDPIYLWFMFNASGTDANVEISEIGGI